MLYRVRHGTAERPSRRAARLCAAALLLSVLPRPAQADPSPRQSIAISPRRLGDAIRQLALQTGRQVVFAPSSQMERRSWGVAGTMTFETALRRLLRGSGLAFREGAGGVVFILREGAAERPPAALPPRPVAPPSPPLVVTARPAADAPNLPGDVRIRPAITDLAVFAQETPGLAAQPSGAGRQGLVVRGIGMAGEATSMVYFADVPISGPSGTGTDAARTASDLLLVDIGRMAASRTSLATRHGVGVLAGEVAIEPEAPRLGAREGFASAGVTFLSGGEAGYQLVSAVNLPTGRSSALRITAYGRRNGGYVDNVRTGARNVNADEVHGLRLMASQSPSDRLDLSELFVWQHRRIADSSSWLRDLGAYRTDRYFAAPTVHDFLLARLKAERRLGAARLTSLSAVYRWKVDRRYDRTNITLIQGQDPAGCARYFLLAEGACTAPQMQQYGSYAQGLTPSLLHTPIDAWRILQEVRLAGESGRRWSWVGGGVADYKSESVESGLSSLPDETDLQGRYFGLRHLANRRFQAAAFGDLAWRGAGGLKATVGLRYQWDRMSARSDVIVPNILSGLLSSWPLTVTRSAGLQGRARLDVPVSGGAVLHAQLTRTYRPGGVNNAAVAVSDQLTYGRDRLWSREMGVQASLGPLLSVAATAYANLWQAMQYNVSSENWSSSYLVNIGDATMRGLELEATLHPARGLTARFDWSLIETRLKRVAPVRDFVGGANVGDRVPFVPRQRTQLTLAYNRDLGRGRRLSLGGEWRYQSGFRSTFTVADPNYLETRGFHLVNLSAGVDRGRWGFSLGVRNLFDSRGALRALTNGYGVGQMFSSGPREIALGWNRRW